MAKIAKSIEERNRIDSGEEWFEQTDGTYIGYEVKQGEALPAALVSPPADSSPTVKTWTGYADFVAALTLEQRVAIEELTPAHARVRVMIRDMEHAEIIRSDDPRWRADIEYLLTIRAAEGGDPNLPSAEEWAALLTP